MRLQDALFNWLQMKIVVEGRPDDRSAHDTLQFFAQILEEDHQIETAEISERDDQFIHIRYTVSGETQTMKFDRLAVEQLLHDIESNPRFNC